MTVPENRSRDCMDQRRRVNETEVARIEEQRRLAFGYENLLLFDVESWRDERLRICAHIFQPAVSADVESRFSKPLVRLPSHERKLHRLHSHAPRIKPVSQTVEM